METDTIYCGDCLELMREIPSGSVDLVLTDPPYGIGMDKTYFINKNSQAAATKYDGDKWDSKPMSPQQQAECVRVGNEQMFFGGNYFDLPPSPCWVVWDKNNGETIYADCELIWTSLKTATRLIKWKWQGMLQEAGHQKDYRQHPTQKPLGVLVWLLGKYSKEGDIILDPFCGSGTTCVAAKMLGRRYIGIDISEKYCEIARKRVEAAEKGITVKELEKGKGVLF